MVAVASAAKAQPLTPNLPSHRDPYYAGKWQKPKADRYIDAVSPGSPTCCARMAMNLP